MSVTLKEIKAKREYVNGLRVASETAHKNHADIVIALHQALKAKQDTYLAYAAALKVLEEMGKKFAVDDGEGDFTPEMKFDTKETELKGIDFKMTENGIPYTHDDKGNPMMVTSDCTCNHGVVGPLSSISEGVSVKGDTECPQHGELVKIALAKAIENKKMSLKHIAAYDAAKEAAAKQWNWDIGENK
jgi:hypothetical protein